MEVREKAFTYPLYRCVIVDSVDDAYDMCLQQKHSAMKDNVTPSFNPKPLLLHGTLKYIDLCATPATS